MLEYVKYSAQLESNTEVRNILVSVADDVHGLSSMLRTLAETPSEIEPEQITLLSDISCVISDALDDVLAKLGSGTDRD